MAATEAQSPLKAGSPFSVGDRAEMLEGRMVALQRENQTLREEISRRPTPEQGNEWQTKYNNLYVLYRKIEQTNVDISNRFAKDRSEYQSALHAARMETQRLQQQLSQLQYDNQMLMQRGEEQQNYIYSLQQRMPPPPQYSSTPLQNPPVSTACQTEVVAIAQETANGVREPADTTKTTATSKSKKDAAAEQAKNEAVINHLQKIILSKDEEISRLRKTGPKGCHVAIQHSHETESRAAQTTEQALTSSSPTHKASSESDPIFSTISSLPTSKPIQVKIVPQAHTMLSSRWSDEPFDVDYTALEPVLLSRNSSTLIAAEPASPNRTSQQVREPHVVVAAKPRDSQGAHSKRPPHTDRGGRVSGGPSGDRGRWSSGPAQGGDNPFRNSKRPS